MSSLSTTARVFDSHPEAEASIKELQRRPLDMKKLSIVGALEGPVVVGGLSAIGAARHGLGIPKDRIVQYATAIKADQSGGVAHGPAAEVAEARAILAATQRTPTATHQLPESHAAHPLVPSSAAQEAG